MVPEALSKRIHGVIGLMRTKYESWIVVVAVSMLLIGCANKPKNQLEALGRFWDALGGKTENLIEKVK